MSDSLLNKMLLVVDGSEPSIAAANYAVGLASQTGGQITAVYVVDTATMEYLSQLRIFVSEERDEFEQDLERTGQRYLEYVRTIGSNHGIDVETVQLKGAFHQTILQKARDMAADVIVLGGWHRTVTRKDVASVQRQLILDEADCPVIVVKRR
jgi:nucleotide-binding universal stress UspA family protein